LINNIKIRLGDAANNYSDDLINLLIEDAKSEVSSYCNREIDAELEKVVEKIVVIKLNRVNSEGLASQSYSGTSESYIDGYPADILAVLDRKRKIKVV
jgi:hypothetical protein